MAGKHVRRKTQRSVLHWNGGGGVFANEKDIALTLSVLDADGLPFRFCEKP